MSWIKIDDQMVDHPKIAPLPDAAFRWVHKALSYAGRFLTNGVLPPAFLDQVPKAVRTELVTRRVWERAAGSTRIHDYLKYQPSRAKVERERTNNRQRQEKFQEKFRREKVTGKVTRESRVNNAVSNGVTNSAPTRPGPSPSIKRRTPLPPSGEGGLRIRREHRENAKAILRSRQGYCQHEPQCANEAQCQDLIAHELAQKGIAS